MFWVQELSSVYYSLAQGGYALILLTFLKSPPTPLYQRGEL
jgi:hypothetical protein